MPRDLRKYIHDAREACRLLGEFTRGKSHEDYQADALLRSAVERQFTIIGEAIFQAEKLDPELHSKITDLRQIINFRHILIHGYDAVQNDIVWGIIETELLTLEQQLTALLTSLDETATQGGDAQANQSAANRKENPVNAPTRRKPLVLSETYLHYNNLIWQVPSWGLAIAAGVVVAAHQISKGENVSWIVPVSCVRAMVLFFGAFLLVALTVALYRYRGYQAASAPDPVPTPPFRKPPKATRYLQGALCLTSGIILGLALAEALGAGWLVFPGVVLGSIGWLISEIADSKLVREMNGAGHKAMRPTGSTGR